MKSFKTIYKTIESWADKTPDAAAIEALDRLPLTYSELFGYIRDMAYELRSAGIKKNDRIAVVLENGPEIAAFFLAVSSCSVCSPLNPRYTENEFINYLSGLKPRALVVLDKVGLSAISAAGFLKIPVLKLAPSTNRQAGVCRLKGSKLKGGISRNFTQAEDVALVLHTSGTTSRPKLVPLTQKNICASAGNICRSLNLSSQDRCLNIMPFFHVHALMIVAAVLTAGGSVICTPSFNKNNFFTWLDKFKPTWYTALPTIHQAILSQAVAGNKGEFGNKYKLRFVRSSAGHLHFETRLQLENFFKAPVIESYGMTESALQISSNSPPPKKHKPGSSGRVRGLEAHIINKKGRSVKAGKIGEIIVRGENIIKNYENNSESNKKNFVNGWLKTGDLGYFDDEGYLYIAGRIKEIINRGGEKISPTEVEEVLMRHPMVKQVLVSSMPHPTLGEEVIAAVVKSTGKDTTEHGIRVFAAKELAEFKVPKRIFFVDELPQNQTGKLQRIGLWDKLKGQTPIKKYESGTKEESILKEIWRKVLKAEKIGVDDNFFELGGDSLKLTELYIEINIYFPGVYKIQDLFDNLTIRELVDLKKEKRKRSGNTRKIKKN